MATIDDKLLNVLGKQGLTDKPSKVGLIPKRY